MALSGQPGCVQAQISVRIHAPLECFHSSLYSSPLIGGTMPVAQVALAQTPYSFQLGPMKLIQYSPSSLESTSLGAHFVHCAQPDKLQVQVVVGQHARPAA